ncbi:hypothetical protein CLCR_03203 [Cladophialophora carrionii]|uniref:Uncharacterized protein n=1 Tax=Cladophialophora carrionii TaxID=86049 RepID=A0A1C1D1I1_9EURO|nr:hypothetical protein CLCR_03203 [Cladophialophora carrionii]
MLEDNNGEKPIRAAKSPATIKSSGLDFAESRQAMREYNEAKSQAGQQDRRRTEESARPWRTDASKQPIPIHHLKGIGEQPHPSLPRLPPRWEQGIRTGVWNRQ